MPVDVERNSVGGVGMDAGSVSEVDIGAASAGGVDIGVTSTDGSATILESVADGNGVNVVRGVVMPIGVDGNESGAVGCVGVSVPNKLDAIGSVKERDSGCAVGNCS